MNKADLKDEKIRLETKKQMAEQRLKQEYSNKYEYEVGRADGILQDIDYKKQQLMVQLQERYKTKINSQIYSSKLEFERA